MKRIIFTILSLVVFLNIFCVDTVHAEERSYYIHAYDGSSTVFFECTPPQDIEVYAVDFGTYLYVICAHPEYTYDPAFDGLYYKIDGSGTKTNLSYNIYQNWAYHEFIPHIRENRGTPVGLSIPYSTSYDTDVDVFDSFSSLANYMDTGDTSGLINNNKPQYDLSVEHDFNSDVWSPDVPVPELSKISHTGFTLENWTEEYYIDIIVSNHLSRVRMMQNASGGSTVPTVVDTSPWYSEHYWNFTLHDVLASRAVVDINEIYGVDIQGALLDDFKNWSVDYPTIKDIQGYSWTHIGQSDEYLARHVYNVDSDLSDVEQLKNSGQAQTEYYVRYVTLDGKYSQWAHYRLRDYSYNGQGDRVDVGRVTTGTVDNTGNTSSPITGTTDSSGNIDYTPIITTPSINTDMDFGEFLNLLETSSNVLQQFPLFLSQLFLFLPWWVNALIACAIAMCILLRIVGR